MSRYGVANDEIKALVASQTPLADVLRRFFLRVERAVVMGGEVFVAPVELSAIAFAQSAVRGDFKGLAEADAERAFGEILVDGKLRGEPSLDDGRRGVGEMKPGSIGVVHANESSLFDQRVPSDRKNVRINALPEWASVADLLFERPSGRDPVAGEDTHEPLAGEDQAF
jgi:hypothetical protein